MGAVHSPAGQSAIHLRQALVAGDARAALGHIGSLDEDHRVEVLLGAALRDRREGFAAVGAYLRARQRPDVQESWVELCNRLCSGGDAHWDEAAAGLVVRHLLRAPGDERPRAPDATAPALVQRIQAGAAVAELLATFEDHPLQPAVRAYYAGTIVAMGWRPLLLLALVPAGEVQLR